MRQFTATVNERTAPSVLEKLCEFYGLVALKSDGNLSFNPPRPFLSF